MHFAYMRCGSFNLVSGMTSYILPRVLSLLKTDAAAAIVFNSQNKIYWIIRGRRVRALRRNVYTLLSFLTISHILSHV